MTLPTVITSMGSCTEQFAQEKDCTEKGSVAEPSPIEGVTAMIQERMRIIPPAPLERAKAERRISFNAQQSLPVASAVHLGGWAWRHQGKIRWVRTPTIGFGHRQIPAEIAPIEDTCVRRELLPLTLRDLICVGPAVRAPDVVGLQRVSRAGGYLLAEEIFQVPLWILRPEIRRHMNIMMARRFSQRLNLNMAKLAHEGIRLCFQDGSP
ncbi:hypothetical protein DFH09DRAFT_1100618 [Mycena vulgaris]|nr:hypothetical protein DFH09DRAFT_1100618 [Mycena vulgaris]